MFGSVTANELLIDKGKPEIDKGKPNKYLKKQSKLALPLSERQSKNQNLVRLHVKHRSTDLRCSIMGGVTLKKYFIKRASDTSVSL